MNSTETIRILLVHPPVASLSIPPWSMAKTASYLTEKGFSPEQYDANLDFFLNQLLTSKQLPRLVGLIEKKEKQGVFKTAGSETVSVLSDLASEPDKWTQMIANIGSDLEVLRTDNFFSPEIGLKALRNIDLLLSLASLAYYPSCIQRRRFCNPTVKNYHHVKKFIDDSDINPFLSLCQRGLISRLKNLKPILMLLCVSGPDQLLAALTMASFGKRWNPQLHVALMGDHKRFADVEANVDTLLSETDPGPLLKLVERLSRGISFRNTAGHKLSGLILKEYLSPTPVLPLWILKDADSGLIPPKLFGADLTEFQRGFNTKECKNIDLRFEPAYIAKQISETTETEPSFCLSLSSHLNESAGRESLALALKVGVRMIQWGNPSGLLKSLTQLLWDASRAGIWNHVIVAEKQDNSLEMELVKFVASNPNIVHSWVFRQSSEIAFIHYSDKLPVSAVYTQVSKLPGRPFWHALNDPAYLLLYLSRYSAKKILRWRVKDKEDLFYELGKNIAYYFVKPWDLPEGYLDEICLMIEAGGSVDTAIVRYNLERAFLIGYAMEHGVIVGNSSLKRPRTEYVEAVNRQAGLDLSNYLERGYTSVRPEYRGMGIGAKLLEGLTEKVGDMKLFSIISSDNVAAQKMALKNQTRRVATFYSKKLGKEVGVWMPEWMIED